MRSGPRLSRQKFLLIICLLIVALAAGWFIKEKLLDSAAPQNSTASDAGDEPAGKPSVDPKVIQASLDEWLPAHTSAEWGVMLTSLEDGQTLAAHNASKTFNIASVYKLFLLQPLVEKVAPDTWKSASVGGRNLEMCVDYMLRLSDNDCAMAIAEFLVWRQVDVWIRDHGYAVTSINKLEYLPGTPEETVRVLTKLEAGEGLPEPAYAKVFKSLGQPKPIEGIRHGCLDCSNVWSKMGDYEGALNDAAILEKDGRKYVLVIFSDGGSWEEITNLTSTLMGKL